MKSAIRYVLIAGIATLAVVMIYFYREYMGEDPGSATEKRANPLVDTRLNAIVTDTSSSSINTPDSLKIGYTDLETKEAASFMMNYGPRPAIAIGDTVTKDKGEKLLLVYKKNGTIVTVPIE